MMHKDTALSVDSISIFGIGQPTDSMLLDSAVAVTQVYLPLRFTQDSTQYVIHYEQQGLSSPRYNDTLTFVYRSYPYFVSIDCGAMYNFVIDTCRYTRNILDSVSVTVPEITNKNVESIRIFYTVSHTEYRYRKNSLQFYYIRNCSSFLHGYKEKLYSCM